MQLASLDLVVFLEVQEDQDFLVRLEQLAQQAVADSLDQQVMANDTSFYHICNKFNLSVINNIASVMLQMCYKCNPFEAICNSLVINYSVNIMSI